MISVLSSNPKESMRIFIRDYKYLIEKVYFNINKVVLKNGNELEFCNSRIGKRNCRDFEGVYSFYSRYYNKILLRKIGMVRSLLHDYRCQKDETINLYCDEIEWALNEVM